MALTVTVAGTTSDSFASIVEADAYFNTHWSVSKQSAWQNLGAPEKESVLRAAARIIGTLKFHDVPFAGIALPTALDTRSDDVLVSVYDVDQALPFPRNVDVLDNVAFILRNVKDAQCEQAVFLLTHDESPITTQLSGVMEEAIGVGGGARVYTQFNHRGSFISPMALELLKPYLRAGRKVRRS